MILQSLEVQGWRCFARPLLLAGFDDRLNVIHAPNGTGKSTLLDALARAFFDRHTTSGEAAETLRPWGRELPPIVTICFVCEGKRYRVSKQFLDSPSCQLEEMEGEGEYVPVAKGPQATERLRNMLQGSPPGHGLCDVRHWGLAQILWAPQGDLSLDIPDSVAGHVQASLTAQLTAGSGDIEQRIDQLYASFFTPKGRVKSGAQAPPIAALERELAEAFAERDRLRALLDEYGCASEEVTRLAGEKLRIEAAIRETENLLVDARKRAEIRARIMAKVDSAMAVSRAAEAEYGRLRQTVEQIASARREASEARRESEELAARLPEAEETERRLDVQRRTAHAAVEAAEQAAAPTELEALVDSARAWAETERHHRELSDLERRAAEADAERRELARRRADLGPAPDRQLLGTIRDALRRRDTAAARLEAALITLTLEPAPDAPASLLAGATVVTADRPEPGSTISLLPGGQSVAVQGAPEVVVNIPGFGRLRARGPAGSADQLRRTLAEAGQEVADLTAPFGTEDLARLEEVSATAQDLALRQEAAVHTLKSILAPFRSGTRSASAGEGRETVLTALAALRGKIAELAARLEALLEQHPEWRTTPPDPAALQRRLDDLMSARQRELTALRMARTEADTAHRRARDVFQRLRSGVEHAQVRRRDAERRLADLLAADTAGEPADLLSSGADRDAQRQAELNRLAMDRSAALQRLGEAQGELKALDASAAPGTPSDPAALEARLTDLRDRLQRAVADEARRQGELVRLAADAPYSRLAETEERIAELEARAADERQRMQAVRLLRSTAESCRRSAFESVLEPVQQSATGIFRRLAGDRLGPVRLGGSFSVQGVVPEGLESPVDPRFLSGGEREQLHFAVRLALARELARTERRLFVLDDALAATDRARHARVRELLVEAAEEANLQVLVLTCHPEAYEEWRVGETARFFNLQNCLSLTALSPAGE